MRKCIVLLVLLLVGCGADWHGHGTVVSKHYEPESSTYHPGYYQSGSCSGSGSARSCTSDVYIPGYTTYDAPVWSLKVNASDTKGNVHGHTVEVPESVWNSCRVNQSFNTDTQECTAQ